MVDSKIVKEWLTKAEEDCLYAKACLEDELEFFAQICFHFQQAAEKYLKTYIIANELKFERVHDLKRLLNICKERDSSFDDLTEEANALNRYYVDTRYPVHWPTSFKKENANEAMSAAETIRAFIKQKLCL